MINMLLQNFDISTFFCFDDANAKKVYVNISSTPYTGIAPLTSDVTCSNLQRYGKNLGEKKL